jgi:GNAT superfamily N-acetyltransferase
MAYGVRSGMMIDPSNVQLRDLEAGDIGWLIQRHAELYAEHEGFDESFEFLVAEILIAHARNHDPETERGWIATDGQRRLGSIFCVQSGEPGIAKLRLFLLEPGSRGLGLGQRLLGACISFAKSKGYLRIRLWTHESHRAACALYAKNGFACVASTPVRSFGQDLIEQIWELELT